MRENWRVYNKSYQAIQNQLGIAPVLAKILANRIQQEDAQAYMDREGELSDPMRMRDMDRAVALVMQNIREGNRIYVIGDYDVDGMTSSTILGKVLKKLQADVKIRIPDRIEDGYGIRPYMVEECAKEGTGLILTCDNGIREFEAAHRARELGITLIITDHHELKQEDGRDVLPEADAVVNPHRQDDPYPFEKLCGAGVAYQLARALLQQAGIPEDPDWIGYAALGTVCDVMPLIGENRKIVYQGLRQWNRKPPTAIRALMKQGGIEKLDVYAFGFIIGPMINSGGRLDEQQHYIMALLEEDPERAEKAAAQLYELNRLRQKMTEEGIQKGLVELEKQPEDRVLVIYLPELHESLAGLVAGRIREKTQKPVFVLTGRAEHVKGSGRSIPAYNMVGEMQRTEEFFLRYGGHPMAAGLSMEESRIEGWRRRLNENCVLTQEDCFPVVYIDMTMPLQYADDRMAELLEVLEPYGSGNPKPVFADKTLKLIRLFWMGKQKKAARLVLEQQGRIYEGVCFRTEWLRECLSEGYSEALWNRLDRGEQLENAPVVDICYNVGWNVYRGRKSLQIVITNIRCSFSKA